MTTVPEVSGEWRKSRRSAQETDCVEIAWSRQALPVARDSKNPDGPILRLPAGFATAVTNSRFER